MIVFHRFLIGTAILFCAGFAMWEFGSYRESGGAIQLSLAVTFALFAVGFAYYLKHLNRFLRR